MSTAKVNVIAPRSGVAFKLQKGQRLVVINPEGQQVSDILAFNQHDTRETFSNGRTFDYNNGIYLTTGNVIYSNRSNKMLSIVEDTVGRHDFLFTPCSRDTFRIKYPDKEPHQGCFGNLAEVLQPHGISEDQITIPFNCFMNVLVGQDGKIEVKAPLSKAGGHIDFVAEMDLVVGLTTCSAHRSNAGSFKAINYRIV